MSAQPQVFVPQGIIPILREMAFRTLADEPQPRPRLLARKRVPRLENFRFSLYADQRRHIENLANLVCKA
jgi:hypothetical protein